ncbi:MAG TPA: N-acetyl-gamma-glutamyl-phosphate reductase [Bryobacteraceae bacterium]|jgi:N-acetyl-gamma-glutamyl-phosphate reductase|nr:N-acetyl-gamma-glutamyl-phosphate reductase [Bryobacteraceae bacterium]
MSFSVGIVGFSGYSGAEAVALLQRHPGCEPVLLEHRADTGDASKFMQPPASRRASADAESVKTQGLTAVLLATPPEASMELTPKFLAAGAIVVDLSGAFRLRTPDRYKTWYKADHAAPELFSQAVYGLPEYFRNDVRKARLISNPGCYPTAANLAIRPLIAAGVVNREAGIVCDAKSGVSGAGRKPALSTSFCEVIENFSAYSLLKHRHVPEVLLTSGIHEDEFSFSAQLLPIHRGILETIYFRMAKPLSTEEILAIYQKQYAGEPFIRLYAAGKVPDLHAVAHTNFCDIGVMADPASGRCVVVSAIDNLGKGAAGQAIQNLNLALGFEETAGLL